MQIFHDSTNNGRYAFEDDVKITQDQSGNNIFTAPNGIQLQVPTTLVQGEPKLTSAEKLKAAKDAQLNQIKRGFYEAVNADVTDSNGVAWNGGWDSGQKLFLACQLAQQNGATTVDLWDKSNTKHSLSIADGMKVAAAVGAPYQAAFAKLQDLKAQIAAVTTSTKSPITTVQSITWS